MKCQTRVRSYTLLVPPALLLLCLQQLDAQQEKVAAFKQALDENQKRLAQYRWIETTIISLKGEEKSRVVKQCFYGPDGKVQKQQISAPPQEQQQQGRLKGKVVAKKKEEITDYMQQAAALVHQYVPPDSQRIQAAQGAGNLALVPTGSGAVRLDLKNYLKQGDSFSLDLDAANNAIQKVSVRSYIDSAKDAISLDVSFAYLPDGVSYPGNTVLLAPEKKIQVVVQNTGYQMVAGAAQVQAPPQQAQAAPPAAPPQQPGPALSPQQLDGLTAPIALYPDALIAQILQVSTDFGQLQDFAGWLSKNKGLTGEALQDAAQKAGFDTPYVALAVFPQVVDSLMQKPDATVQIGQAFAADHNAVFDSIQRLRVQAQTLGNLKSSPQQQVRTQTSSTGSQVIVIQPANPQVIYVPTYNPQVVYVQSAPPPGAPSAAGAALMGFTAGVIIGAKANNNYYYGPYAWHGPPMVNQTWNNTVNYNGAAYNGGNYPTPYQQNQAQRVNNANTVQNTSAANQSQRQTSANTAQSNAAANQSQRQAAANTAQSNTAANQSQRQASATNTTQANQAARQSSAASAQSSRQSQANTSSRASGQSSAQRSGMGGGGSYQSGAATQAQSSRGSSSLSSSRSGGVSGGSHRR